MVDGHTDRQTGIRTDICIYRVASPLKTKCSHETFFTVKLANVALLLSTISDSYAKMENQDTATDLPECPYVCYKPDNF